MLYAQLSNWPKCSVSEQTPLFFGSVYKNMEKVTNFRTTLLFYILVLYFGIIYAIELNPGEVDGFYLDISASGSQHKS